MPGDRSANVDSVVLLRQLGTGMLRDIVTRVLDQVPGVAVFEDELPPDLVADLIVERDNGVVDDMSPTILFAENGRSLLVLPIEQLTEATLTMAIRSLVDGDRSWLDAVLLACRRIDDLIERATATAMEIYGDGGSFTDWRAAFAEANVVTETRAGDEPLASPLAPGWSDPEQFLADLGASRLAGSPADHLDVDHPFAQLVAHYGLSGRDIDVLLLCFVNELDPRYGRRFAYLQQDVRATEPTIDLVAALLASTAADRLALQRDFYAGSLVEAGLIELHRAGSYSPLRSSSLALDPSIARMLLGDDRATADQQLIDPVSSPRAEEEYRPTAGAVAASMTLDAGRAVHLAGADGPARQSVAIDLALERERRLLVAEAKDLAMATTGPTGDHLRPNGQQIERFRRELMRLGAIGFVPDLPDQGHEWPAAVDRFGPTVITGGPAALRLADRSDGPTRQTVAIDGPRGEEREAVWRSAEAWTGIEIREGTEPLAARSGCRSRWPAPPSPGRHPAGPAEPLPPTK